LREGEERLRAYSAFLYQSCQRAGLLVAGSLKSVLDIALEKSAGAQSTTSITDVRELSAFYFSRELLALRREIGMAS